MDVLLILFGWWIIGILAVVIGNKVLYGYVTIGGLIEAAFLGLLGIGMAIAMCIFVLITKAEESDCLKRRIL